ncbi:MAG: hypothetical protein FJZ64_00330 [Chlamydiae bacterium]|nr:hypothetical protein [Chlamydiota bacterium]
MTRVLKWLKKEFFRVLPVFLFFFLSFNIGNGMAASLLKRAGLSPFSFFEVFLAAALIAKIFLVIDHLPILLAYRKKPLIFVVFGKTALYWGISFVFRLTIRFFPYLFVSKKSIASFETFCQQFDWSFFFTIQTWYLMLFFLFITARELAFVIGPTKMREIFFGKSRE